MILRMQNQLPAWSPWKEAERLQNELLSLVESPFSTRTGLPALNLWQQENELIATVELPGFNTEDVTIELQGTVLTISGEPKAESTEGRKYFLRERRTQGFTRRLQLPFRVDGDRTEARFERGILFLRLFRAQADMPRKIEIRTGRDA